MTGTGIRFIEQNPASAEFDRQTEIRRREDQRQTDNERVDQDREDRMTKTALTALAAGDMTTFNTVGQQIGLTDKLPPQAIEDGQTRRLIGMGGLIADATYGDEDQQAAFMRAYLESRGDEAAAAAAVGPPRNRGSGRASRPNEGVIETVMRNGREVKVLVDQVTGEVRGEIGEAPPSRGGATVSGRTLNQNQLATLRTNIADQLRATDPTGWRGMSEEQRQAAIDSELRWRISEPGGGFAPATPAPQAAGGGQQFAFEAEDGQGNVIVSNDGQSWFTLDGRKVQ